MSQVTISTNGLILALATGQLEHARSELERLKRKAAAEARSLEELMTRIEQQHRQIIELENITEAAQRSACIR